MTISPCSQRPANCCTVKLRCLLLLLLLIIYSYQTLGPSLSPSGLSWKTYDVIFRVRTEHLR